MTADAKLILIKLETLFSFCDVSDLPELWTLFAPSLASQATQIFGLDLFGAF